MSAVVVIGAGAAGLMCAAKCALNGHSVTVIEKMNRPGRKLGISGKGRCNLTNAVYDLDELIENVPTNPRFLYSAFSHFMPYDTMELFESLGVPLKVERGNRVFPVSDRAADIVDALVGYAKTNGVKIINGRAVSFDYDGSRINAVILESGERIACDFAVLATGGKSYPATGSTGDGYALAKSVGHTVTEIKPSLVPLICNDAFIPELQGLSLKNIAIKLYENGRVIYTDFGEMLFTHSGVSGPVILSASSHIRSIGKAEYALEIDLKPALDEPTLDKRVQRDFAEQSNKDFINSLSKLLPKKLIPVIVSLSSVEPDEKVNGITREKRLELVRLLKHFRLNVKALGSIDEAIVTCGGVSVKEIEPKTMKSKIADNLFFAGEIIDVDAYTGGFNLQIAFSTAALCADSIK
jgi:hypothetical protein